MEQDRLPSGLTQLEATLLQRMTIEPGSTLRLHVLAGVAKELKRARRTNALRFVAALAAAFLIWANVSLLATQMTDADLVGPDDVEALHVTAAQLMQTMPHLSQQEAYRHAIVFHAQAQLIVPPVRTRDSADPSPLDDL